MDASANIGGETAPRVLSGNGLVPLLLLGFAAGSISVLVFHQAVIWGLHATGAIPNPPFPMRAVPPLNVPQIYSLAFWGGVWGVVIAAIHWARPRWNLLLVGLAVGAIGCVLVGWTVVAGLRGQPLMAGWDMNRWWRSILINGIFGLGVGLLLLPFRRRED